MNPCPIAIGHRGACGVAPENTRASFLKALELGAEAIEFDVRLSADGRVVVIHDGDLGRTTNGHGRVEETPFAELAKLDAGSWFGDGFQGCRVPTLAEVLDDLVPHVTLNVELKPAAGFEALVRGVVADVADRDAFGSVVFSSFHGEAIDRLRDLVPDARLGVLFTSGSHEYAFAAARRLQAENLHAPVDVTDDDLCKRAHGAGLRVWTWTANDPGVIARLCRLGVDGIVSDFPDRVLAAR